MHDAAGQAIAYLAARENVVHIWMLKRRASQTAYPVIPTGVPDCVVLQGNQFYPGQSGGISVIMAAANGAYCQF